jgi:hypothetical protein
MLTLSGRVHILKLEMDAGPGRVHILILEIDDTPLGRVHILKPELDDASSGRVHILKLGMGSKKELWDGMQGQQERRFSSCLGCAYSGLTFSRRNH